MEVKRLSECPPKNPALLVKVTEMGNVLETQYMSRRNCKQTIQMLPGGDQMLVLSTGELVDIKYHDSRAENQKNLRKTFSRLRAVINTNVADVSKARWITLTYAENMKDAKRLYKDFEKFNKRFQYHCKKKGYGKAEYIIVMEPQKRGAWHAHLLYIFDAAAPFIPNDELSRIWGHGFVKIKKLDSVDNVGAYLTAYLGDLPLSECTPSEREGAAIKEVEVIDEATGKRQKKRFVKGARLHMYPPKFNLYRCSRGIKKPTSRMCSQEEADEIVKDSVKTYEKTVMLQDTESDFETVINTVYYNRQRKRCSASLPDKQRSQDVNKGFLRQVHNEKEIEEPFAQNNLRL
ncbi:MAG: hypothetical protein LIO67_04065 [Lachnospiraceae bacterium]|nr:hypothetical protein [Lachnospiraceae bacterium]